MGFSHELVPHHAYRDALTHTGLGILWCAFLNTTFRGADATAREARALTPETRHLTPGPIYRPPKTPTARYPECRPWLRSLSCCRACRRRPPGQARRTILHALPRRPLP